MAKKITIDIEVNGKMQKATVSAKKLRSALDGVDNATDRTTDGTRTLDRNLKGAAKTTSNSTKEFSKMAQGMGGLVGAYATVAASVFALSAAFQFFKQAADLAALTAGQEAFAARTGVSLKLLTSNVQAATGGLVAFKEAAQAVAIGQAAGLTADQMERLGKVAKNAGTILGRDVTDAFNRLTRGAIKAEPELLDELGIIIRLDRASRDYAASLNKNVSDLTQFEKTQGVVNAVLEQGEGKFKDVGDSINQVAQFGAAFQDTFKDLAKPIAAVANFVAGALKDSIYAVSAVIGILGLNIIKSFAPTIPVIQSTAQAGIDARKRLMAIAQTETSSTTALKIRQGQFEESVLKQIVQSAQAKTSQVINLSMMETQEIIRDVEIIRAQNLRMTRDGKNFFKSMIASWELDLMAFQAQYGKRFALMRMITAKFAMQFSRVLSAATFAGMLVMLVELGKEFRKTFVISKELRDAERQTEDLTKKMGDQLKAVAEVESKFTETDNTLTLVNRNMAILSNINLTPVIRQTNLFADALNKLKNVEMAREKGAQLQREGPVSRSYDTRGGVQQFLDRTAVAGMTMGSSKGGLPAAAIQMGVQKELNSQVTITAKNIADLNQQLIDLATQQREVDQAFEESIATLNVGEQAIRRVAHAAETSQSPLTQTRNALEAMANNDFNTNLISQTDQGKVLLELSRGLEASVPNFEKAFELIQKTGLDTDANEAGITKMKRAIEAFIISLSGVDPVLAQALGNKAKELYEDNIRALQKTQQNAARLSNAYEAISKAVAGFGEASQKFTPKSSQFSGLFSALDEIDNNFKNIQKTLGDESFGKSLKELFGTDTGTSEAVALKQAASLIGEIGEQEILQLTPQQIQIKLKKIRNDLAQQYFTLELRSLEVQKNQVGLAEKSLDFEKDRNSAISTFLKTDQALAALQQEKNTYVSQGLNLDSQQGRLLQARINLAEAENDLAKENLRIEGLLLPLKREKFDLQVQQEILQANENLNRELQKQIGYRKQIVDTMMEQAEKRGELAIRAEAIRNPFLNKEMANAQFRLDLEQALFATRTKIINDEFDKKALSISNEYKLLSYRAEISAIEAQIKAKELRERKGATQAQLDLADKYDRLANIQMSFIPQFKEGEKLALALNESLREMSLFDLSSSIDEMKLALEELKPMNQFFQDVASAFRDSLSDTFNVLFTSLYDNTVRVKDALKDVARGLLQTIQKAMIDKLIVGPLLESLNLGDDTSEKLKNAIIAATEELERRGGKGVETAAQTVETAGTNAANEIKTKMDEGAGNVATKIREALRDIELRVKVDCCDSMATVQPKPEPPPIPEVNPPMAPSLFPGAEELELRKAIVGSAPAQPSIPGYAAFDTALPQGNLMGGMTGGLGTGPTVELGPMSLQAIKAPGPVGPGGVDEFGNTIGTGGGPATGTTPGKAGGADDPKVTATEENTSKLGEVGEVLGENVFAIGGSVAALMGNSKVAQKLQKAMAVLHLAMMVQRIITKLQTKSEMANTVVEKANTAAVATLTKVMIAKPAAKGLYPPLGYGDGGIARGPKAGYPAILHGDEAVVPLPDGKKIPVDLNIPNRGQMAESSQQNNVTVNLSIEGGRTERSEGADSEEARQLGVAITAAVQKELINQKRPGGILSPHGVA